MSFACIAESYNTLPHTLQPTERIDEATFVVGSAHRFSLYLISGAFLLFRTVHAGLSKYKNRNVCAA